MMRPLCPAPSLTLDSPPDLSFGLSCQWQGLVQAPKRAGEVKVLSIFLHQVGQEVLDNR